MNTITLKDYLTNDLSCNTPDHIYFTNQFLNEISSLTSEQLANLGVKLNTCKDNIHDSNSQQRLGDMVTNIQTARFAAQAEVAAEKEKNNKLTETVDRIINSTRLEDVENVNIPDEFDDGTKVLIQQIKDQKKAALQPEQPSETSTPSTPSGSSRPGESQAPSSEGAEAEEQARKAETIGKVRELVQSMNEFSAIRNHKEYFSNLKEKINALNNRIKDHDTDFIQEFKEEYGNAVKMCIGQLIDSKFDDIKILEAIKTSIGETVNFSEKQVNMERLQSYIELTKLMSSKLKPVIYINDQNKPEWKTVIKGFENITEAGVNYPEFTNIILQPPDGAPIKQKYYTEYLRTEKNTDWIEQSGFPGRHLIAPPQEDVPPSDTFYQSNFFSTSDNEYRGDGDFKKFYREENESQYLFLFGPSGAGKTTIANKLSASMTGAKLESITVMYGEIDYITASDVSTKVGSFNIKLTYKHPNEFDPPTFYPNNPEELTDFPDLKKSYENYKELLNRDFLSTFAKTVTSWVNKYGEGAESAPYPLIDTVNYFLKHIGWILQTINNPESSRCAVSYTYTDDNRIKKRTFMDAPGSENANSILRSHYRNYTSEEVKRIGINFDDNSTNNPLSNIITFNTLTEFNLNKIVGHFALGRITEKNKADRDTLKIELSNKVIKTLMELYIFIEDSLGVDLKNYAPFKHVMTANAINDARDNLDSLNVLIPPGFNINIEELADEVATNMSITNSQAIKVKMLGITNTGKNVKDLFNGLESKVKGDAGKANQNKLYHNYMKLIVRQSLYILPLISEMKRRSYMNLPEEDRVQHYKIFDQTQPSAFTNNAGKLFPIQNTSEVPMNLYLTGLDDNKIERNKDTSSHELFILATKSNDIMMLEEKSKLVFPFLDTNPKTVYTPIIILPAKRSSPAAVTNTINGTVMLIKQLLGDAETDKIKSETGYNQDVKLLGGGTKLRRFSRKNQNGSGKINRNNNYRIKIKHSISTKKNKRVKTKKIKYLKKVTNKRRKIKRRKHKGRSLKRKTR